jgi:predicted permease
MRALKRWFARIVNFVTGRRGDQRLHEEMREHLIRQTEENIRAGMAPAEARRQAVLKFGHIEAIRESYHAEEGLPSIEGLIQDVRYAARLLLKSRGFTVVASTSLALAIGANTTIFSVAKQLLYERLAVPQAANLRLLTWTGTKDHVAVHAYHHSLPGGLIASEDFSYPVYEQLRSQNRVLGDLLVFHVTGMNATAGDDAERVTAHEVSGNYYSVLGVQPQLGRTIEPSDDTAASQPVAVISDEFWTREFARSPAVLGQWIKLNNVPVMIVGVNPKGFTGAESTLPADTPAVTVALAKAPILTPPPNGSNALADPADWGGLYILGRTRAGVSDSAAQAALDTQLSAIVRATIPMRAGEDIPRLVLRDGSRGLFPQKKTFGTPMSVLMIFVGLVLLLACANIANLMLARGAQRQREMSVRLALGAGRARILRQMLVESLLLAFMGGVSGLAIGYWGRAAIPQFTRNVWGLATFPVHFDWQVFAFTAAVTVLTAVLFGLAPALSATRADVTHGLKEGGRTATRARRGFAGKSVAGFQIALSTLLVIGAGLFVRSLAGLNAVDPGFRSDHLLLAQIVLPQNRYPPGANTTFHQRLEQAIAAIPGVESISAGEYAYLSHDLSSLEFWPEGEASDPGNHRTEAYNAVGMHFFETLGIPMVTGRAFGAHDTATSPKVGIINQSLAKTRFPNQNPIGRRFSVEMYGGYGDILTSRPIEIVGICADTLHADLNRQPPPQFFIPYVQQTSIRRLTYEIRTRTKPESMVSALRRVVHAADPELPLVHVRTQQEQIDSDLEEARLFVTLTSSFGMLALVLASVGIYGVMAYSVAQRTHEIGIRQALGASPRQVLSMVLSEASWLSAAGVAAGVGASFLLNRLVKSMLYGIAPYDPATLWGAVLLLLTVALGASWIPARRAARVQPLEALRRD